MISTAAVTPNARGPNSRCTIRDGSVIRLPTENPNSAQAPISNNSSRELMTIASAMAGLTNEIADASRWLSRSITVENSTRPATATAVSWPGRS
jgi:hypothetical protein